MLDDLPAPRFALQRLRDDLAEFAQARAAALAADARCGMKDALARQVVRQRPARRFACINRASTFGCWRGGDLSLCRNLGLRLLEVRYGKFELFDDLLAALGGLTELRAPRLGEQELQPFDLEAERAAFALGFDQTLALRQYKRMGSSEIGRQRLRGRNHMFTESRMIASREPTVVVVHSNPLSRGERAPSSLRGSPIDPLQ